MSFSQVMPRVWQCDECGANSLAIESINHYPSCKSYWPEVYGPQEQESEIYCDECEAIKEIGLEACLGCCGRK